ncbi:MAG: DHH family phosphoesterase, partial [Planctomycetota bacterium]
MPAERPDDVARLSAHLRISDITARLLVNRGLSRPDEAQRFLQPSLHELKDPCDHEVVTEAARFLLEAARADKRITIFGDYDADGICAAALLMRCFGHFDADVDLYIPHRVEEGYGLSCEALEELATSGTGVVLTVDCGTSAFEEVTRARELGMEVVVTDHHEPRDGLPEATHLLNPKLPHCGFGYENLAGV